jgi:hypothetical protein
MINLPITPALLVAVCAALLAILFDWFPPVAQRYDALSELKKKQVMIVCLVIVVAAIYGGICVDLFVTSLACNKAGLSELIYMALLSAGVNQGIHNLTKPSTVSAETERIG